MFMVMTGLKSIIAITAVASLQVYTVTIPTNIGIGNTLIDISAVICKTYLLVTLRADAHERSNQVLTHKLAVIGRSHTFIHICIRGREILTMLLQNTNQHYFYSIISNRKKELNAETQDTNVCLLSI